MSGIVFSPKARLDLAGVWEFSCDQWGPEQADTYSGRLSKALSSIAADPRRGTAVDHIGPGYRRMLSGSHVIFFKVRPRDVYVVRILHQRMDFARYL